MKIKRFVADNMRQALRMVREEQGPDAVILSNERINGGIEIIAAVDYDESLIQQSLGHLKPPARSTSAQASTLMAGPDKSTEAEVVQTPDEQARVELPFDAIGFDRPDVETPKIVWSQEPTLISMRREMESMRALLEQQVSRLAWTDVTHRNPVRARLIRLLCGIGLKIDIARGIADQVDAEEPRVAINDAFYRLANSIAVTEDDVLDAAGVIALVGPTGVGKTTTIAKLAARFVLRHGRDQLALISTDSFRIGAQEQLMTFARILGVAVHTVADEGDMRDVLDSLSDKRLVLIDTAGMSQRDSRLSKQLALLSGGQRPIRLYLTLAASSQADALDQAVQFYGRVPLHGCVLTKLDEASQLGGALTTLLRHQLPLSYLSDGQCVPEDLHAACTKRTWLVKHAARLIKMSGRLSNEEEIAMNYGEVAASA